jgi:group I intron endonuclease
MFTYKATNTSNGKFYIGSTNNFEKRKKGHLKSKESYPFQNALRKNPKAFEWEVWEDNSDEPILEQALLDMFFGTGQCYNLNPIASRPPSHKGRKKTPEHRARIGKAHKGRVKSPEECEKISRAKKGKPPGMALPDGTIPREIVEKRAASRVANGKKWTQEQRKSLGLKIQLAEEEVNRRVTLIKQSGIDLKEWGSLKKVANLLGLTHAGARGFLNKYWSESQ